MSHTGMIVTYIIFAVGVLTMVIGILRMLDWYAIFSHFYGNNPAKSKIYVDFGENEEFYDGEFYTLDNDYLYFRYTMGKKEHTVMRPINYKDIFVRGRLKILVDYGSVYAKPLCEEDVSVVTSLDISSLELNALLKPKLALEMLSSLESRKGIGSLMIIIIAVALVAGFGIFMYARNHESKPVNSNNTTTIIQTTVPANTSGISTTTVAPTPTNLAPTFTIPAK